MPLSLSLSILHPFCRLHRRHLMLCIHAYIQIREMWQRLESAFALWFGLPITHFNETAPAENWFILAMQTGSTNHQYVSHPWKNSKYVYAHFVFYCREIGWSASSATMTTTLSSPANTESCLRQECIKNLSIKSRTFRDEICECTHTHTYKEVPSGSMVLVHFRLKATYC